jgi:endonuclease/exonuclease/phosphatase family metal-dependent hydrolase
VLGTHLDHSKQDLRQLQSIAVDALLDKLVASDLKPIATVLAGDLNDTPKSRTLESFQQRWQMDPRVPSQASATYPSGSPKSRIDYVMVERSGRLELEKLEVLQEPAGSDHLPVLATLLVKP